MSRRVTSSRRATSSPLSNSSSGVGAQAVPGAPAGPPVRGHLDYRPPPAAGAVPRRIQPPCRLARLVPAVRSERAPAVIAVSGLAGRVPRDAHRRTAYARVLIVAHTCARALIVW